MQAGLQDVAMRGVTSLRVVQFVAGAVPAASADANLRGGDAGGGEEGEPPDEATAAALAFEAVAAGVFQQDEG